MKAISTSTVIGIALVGSWHALAQSQIPCDPSKSVLDPLSHRFRSECGYTQWCQPVGSDSISQVGNAGASSSNPPTLSDPMPSVSQTQALGNAPSSIVSASSTQSSPQSAQSPTLQGSGMQAFAQNQPLQFSSNQHNSQGARTLAAAQGSSSGTPRQLRIKESIPTDFSSQSTSHRAHANQNSNSEGGYRSLDDGGVNEASETDDGEASDGSDGISEDGSSDNEDNTDNDGQDSDFRKRYNASNTTECAQGYAGLGCREQRLKGKKSVVLTDLRPRSAVGEDEDDPTQDPEDSSDGILSDPVTQSTVSTGFCVPKGCRRDEFPFGYKGIPTEQLPPLCGNGTYCPDEESSCEPLIPVGGNCQLNRDDSCAPIATLSVPGSSPPSSLLPSRRFRGNDVDSADSSPFTRRATGGNSTTEPFIRATPMCLSGVCHIANVAQGQACVLDHTQYLGYDADGKEVVDTVSRDNCHDALYCDETTLVCLAEKNIGEPCQSDRQCRQFNCNREKVCDIPPEAPRVVPGWSFGLIGVGILLVLITTVYTLSRIHLSHRAARSDEIDRYFSEQWTYRQSILSMHAAAIAAGATFGPIMTAAEASARGVGVPQSHRPAMEEKQSFAPNPLRESESSDHSEKCDITAGGNRMHSHLADPSLNLAAVSSAGQPQQANRLTSRRKPPPRE